MMLLLFLFFVILIISIISIAVYFFINKKASTQVATPGKCRLPNTTSDIDADDINITQENVDTNYAFSSPIATPGSSIKDSIERFALTTTGTGILNPYTNITLTGPLITDKNQLDPYKYYLISYIKTFRQIVSNADPLAGGQACPQFPTMVYRQVSDDLSNFALVSDKDWLPYQPAMTIQKSSTISSLDSVINFAKMNGYTAFAFSPSNVGEAQNIHLFRENNIGNNFWTPEGGYSSGEGFRVYAVGFSKLRTSMACSSYTDTSSNISRECIISMWKNIAGCTNSLTPGMLAYYEQVTKPSTAPAIIIDEKSVLGGSQTLGRITNDAKLWSSLSTMMHRGACYGTDMTKWPKNLLITQADYEGYTDKVKDWVYTNVKAIGAFVNINPGVLDTERAGIIIGNYPFKFATTSQLGFEIHTERRARIYINQGYIDWKPVEPIPLNIWTHIAFVLRNDRIEYYRDGVLKETLMGTTDKPIPILNSLPDIKVGWDNRPKTDADLPYPPKFKLSNLLISQGANSVAWSNEQVANIFRDYKPPV